MSLKGQIATRADRPVVDEHRAGSAYLRLARAFGPGEPQASAEKFKQCFFYRDFSGPSVPVGFKWKAKSVSAFMLFSYALYDLAFR
jgi:hypothetical protein